MASNDTEGEASEIPWMRPVSWTGKKPFGITTYKNTVRTSVAAATTSVSG